MTSIRDLVQQEASSDLPTSRDSHSMLKWYETRLQLLLLAVVLVSIPLVVVVGFAWLWQTLDTATRSSPVRVATMSIFVWLVVRPGYDFVRSFILQERADVSTFLSNAVHSLVLVIVPRLHRSEVEEFWQEMVSGASEPRGRMAAQYVVLAVRLRAQAARRKLGLFALVLIAALLDTAIFPLRFVALIFPSARRWLDEIVEARKKYRARIWVTWRGRRDGVVTRAAN
jgi:hypothetical protein